MAFPTFAVSIAVEHRGRLQHAVVYDPSRQEFFTASRGEGAQLEGKKIRVSSQRTLEGALIGTGFPYRMAAEHIDHLSRHAESDHGHRRRRAPPGRRIARSRLRGGRAHRWLLGVRPAPWDTAAGTLLITEAGGRVGTPAGADYALGPNIVVGNPKVYEGLLGGARASHTGGIARLSAAPSART